MNLTGERLSYTELESIDPWHTELMGFEPVVAIFMRLKRLVILHTLTTCFIIHREKGGGGM